MLRHLASFSCVAPSGAVSFRPASSRSRRFAAAFDVARVLPPRRFFLFFSRVGKKKEKKKIESADAHLRAPSSARRVREKKIKDGAPAAGWRGCGGADGAAVAEGFSSRQIWDQLILPNLYTGSRENIKLTSACYPGINMCRVALLPHRLLSEPRQPRCWSHCYWVIHRRRGRG